MLEIRHESGVLKCWVYNMTRLGWLVYLCGVLVALYFISKWDVSWWIKGPIAVMAVVLAADGGWLTTSYKDYVKEKELDNKLGSALEIEVARYSALPFAELLKIPILVTKGMTPVDWYLVKVKRLELTDQYIQLEVIVDDGSDQQPGSAQFRHFKVYREDCVEPIVVR